MISDIDDNLNEAIIYEQRDIFIEAVRKNASMIAASNNRPKQTLSPESVLQSMIDFVIALDDQEMSRTDTADILKKRLSPRLLKTLADLSANNQINLIKLLRNGKLEKEIAKRRL